MLEINIGLSLIFGFLILSAIVLVGYELYQLVILKRDRMFWSGLGVLSLLIFLSLSIYSVGEKLDVLKFTQSESANYRGAINKGALRDSVLDENSNPIGNACLINDSTRFRQCLFLSQAESGEEILLDYISTDNGIIVRRGHWPFADTQLFTKVRGALSNEKPTDKHN